MIVSNSILRSAPTSDMTVGIAPLGIADISKEQSSGSARNLLLQEALEPVQPALNDLEPALLTMIPLESQTSRAVLEYVFSSRGKRIRPALYFFACELVDYRGEHFFPIAAVCEYVHSASLLHDDVVDSSTLRRNKPTANTIWGDQASVLVGDLVYSRASELMAATGSIEIVDGFARAIRLMSEGELLQLEACFNADQSIEQYEKVIRCKTGELIATCCAAAGILANAPKEIRTALFDFGLNLGMAFQMIDDALDYVGVGEVFGKAVLADLKEGKVTLPLILLLKDAHPEDRDFVRSVIAQQNIDTDDVRKVADLVAKYETDAKSIEYANRFTEKAIRAIDIFPSSQAKRNLIELAERMVWRFN